MHNCLKHKRDGLSRTLPEIYKGLKENSNAMNIASPCAYIGDALRSKYDGTDFSLWTGSEAEAKYYFLKVYKIIGKIE